MLTSHQNSHDEHEGLHRASGLFVAVGQPQYAGRAEQENRPCIHEV